MPLGELMGQLVRGRAERDDEGQVEEELQRGRRAVRLRRVASAHADPVMAAVLDHCGSLGTGRRGEHSLARPRRGRSPQRMDGGRSASGTTAVSPDSVFAEGTPLNV